MSPQFQIRVDDAGRHQVYRTELGVDRVDVGEPWKTPREAIDYSDQLAARASRSAERLTSRSGLGPVEGEPSAQSSEAPGPQDASTSCVACGRDLPPGSRPQRRTCSTACRIALARGRTGQGAANALRADADGGPLVPETVSAAPGPSESAPFLSTPAGTPPDLAGVAPLVNTVPTASAAPSAHRLLGPARDARPEPVSEGPIGAPIPLGL